MPARSQNAVQPQAAGLPDGGRLSRNPDSVPTSSAGVSPIASRELSDQVPRLPRVGIWEHLFPENRMLISDGFCQLAGIDPEEGRNNPAFWTERVHPEDIQRVRAAYVAFLEGNPVEFEAQYRLRHTGGEWMSVLARARWERREGADAGLVRGYVMDVTWSERIRLQAEIIERISEGVMLIARDGIIRFVNPVFESTLGYAAGDLIGRHSRILSFRPSEAFDGLLQTVFDATEKGNPAVIDLEARRSDGALLPLQGRFHPLVIEGSRHVVAVFADITARKQLERDMMRIATQVQQRVGGDLHEGLGQQLSGIAMMMQGLRERFAGVDASDVVRDFDEVVGLLNSAIRRTRLLARGLSPVRPSAEGIKEGFEELVNHVHEVYGLRVRLSLDLPADLLVDENPVTNMFHIAQEAVMNAARHAQASDIRVWFGLKGSELELQVEDDGIGFDPVQAGEAGMGMRMMRFRAEMARGYLSIESRPGHGARLRCRSPARTESPA